MKSVRLALLLFAVLASAAFAGPGVMSSTGDSGGVDCTVTPAPTPPSTETPDPTATLDPTTTPDADECDEPDEPGSPDDDETNPPGDDDSTDEPEENDDADGAKDPNHGLIVSTVAHCAPRGKDPLFEVLDGLRNHGAFVRAAAHGETLAVNGVDDDLSTLDGAKALCAALDSLRASLDPVENDKHHKEKHHRKHRNHKQS